MRFAVLADIHGNLPALEAVLADMDRRGVDGTLVLGDIAARAPFPAETLERVRALGATVIRGNVDQYLLDWEEALGRGETDTSPRTALNRWTYEKMGAEGVSYLRELPEQAVFAPPGVAPLRLVHASPTSSTHGFVPDGNPQALRDFLLAGLVEPGYNPPPLTGHFAGIAERNLACGHTHIPWVQRQGECLAFNPGAVGAASAGDPAAQYALLDWRAGQWQVELRSVPYDLARLKAAFETSGMLGECGIFARAFQANMLTGWNVPYFIIKQADRLARSLGYAGFQELPDTEWAQVDAAFPWEKYPI